MHYTIGDFRRVPKKAGHHRTMETGVIRGRETTRNMMEEGDPSVLD